MCIPTNLFRWNGDVMKKSIEKLFRNEILKKVTMGIMFMFMLSVACFLNWKAVVGAERGTGQIVWQFNDDTCFTREQSDGTKVKVFKIEYSTDDENFLQVYDASSGTEPADNQQQTMPFDTTLPLTVCIYVKNTFTREQSGDMMIVYQEDHLSGLKVFDQTDENNVTEDNGSGLRKYTYKMSANNAERYLGNNKVFRIVPSYSLSDVRVSDYKDISTDLHGNQIPDVHTFDYLNIKYKASDSGAYKSWVCSEKYDDEGIYYEYETLCFATDESFKVKIEEKNNTDISCLQYALLGGSQTVSDDKFGDWDESGEKLLDISSADSYCLYLRGFTDVLKITADNHEGNLFDKLEVKYKYGEYNSYDESFQDFKKTQEGDTSYYAPMRIGQQNSKVTLSVKPKTGYDLSGAKYFLDNIYSEDVKRTHTEYRNPQVPESESLWETINSGNGWTIINLDVGRNPTVTFKGFSYLKLNLSFEGPAGDLPEKMASISLSGGSGSSATSYELDGISETTFTVTLGDNCSDPSLSMNNFELSKEPGSSGTIELSGEVDQDNTRKFNLTVKANTSASYAVIRVKNLTIAGVSLKFNMAENYRYPLLVGIGTDENTASYKDPAEETQDQPWNDAEVQVGSDFKFYLKTKDYAHWSKTFSGEESSPQANTDILSLMKFDQGKINRVTSVYNENTDVYTITLKKVGIADQNPSYTMNITFNEDVTDVNNINITFPTLNLPMENDGNDKIEVKQGTVEYTYPDRGLTPYTLKATVKPTKDNINGATTITLNSTENFGFNGAEFRLGGQTFRATTSSEATCSFVLGNLNVNALKTLKSSDLYIECLCLKPKNKTVTIEDEGFENTAIKDEKGNSYIINDGTCSVPYGSKLIITTTLKDGGSMDDPLGQVKVWQSGEEVQNWGSITKDDYTATVTLESWEILTSDIKIEFISDTNNIPITFKDVEGVDYYYANMEEVDGVNKLSTSEPFVKENGQKKSLKGIVTINSGNDYYFAVGVQSGYDIGNLKIEANDKRLQEYTDAALTDDKKEGCKFYKLEKINSSITVSGEVSKKTMTVKFNGISLKGAESDVETSMVYMSDNSKVSSINVTYGNSVTFTVDFENQGEYGQSDFKVHVKDKNDPSYPTGNGNVLTEYQGEYKILDVTEDKEVYVTGVTVNRYVVNFVANSKAGFLIDDNSFQGTKTVSHGSKIDFKIKAKAGYKLDDETVVNCQGASGDFEIVKKKDSFENGSTIYKCTLSGINENCTITISNINNITYKVTLKDVPGTTYLNDKGSVVSGSMRVRYGSNFEFSVNVDDAYDDSAAGMFIILNDGKSKLHAQKLASGRYMVSNITEDVAIKVGNIRKNSYTVTLRNDEGIDYYNSNDKIITGDNTVDHGSSFSFRVSLYSAYSDSEISVMLGNDKMSADSSGYYTIPGIIEDKTVTVTGIHPNSEVGLINAINNLPSSVNDLNDVNPVIEASRWYNSLPDDKKATVTNADVLMNLQQQAGVLLHNIDGVTIDGVDWYIKLVVVPISSDMDACARIYKKLSSEYILSLYDIYLWDTLNDVKYTSYGDQVYTVTIPAPKLTNFRNPTGVHEDSNSGKVSFMDLMFSGDRVSFETNSFSAMGIVASHDPSGTSSLFDTAGAKLPWIRDYVFGGSRSGPSSDNSSGSTLINDDNDSSDDNTQETGNINDKFRSMNNRVTPQGSALRLILVLLILVLLALALWFIYKKRKEGEQ